MTHASDPRRVTMLVRNAYTNDTRVEREAATLSEAGYAVTVVAEGRQGLPHRERRDGVDVVRVSRPSVRIPGIRFVLHLRDLGRAVRTTRPSILHAHDTDALQVLGPIGERLRLPVVFDSHELWLGRSARGHAPLYHRLAQAWYARIERRHVPSAAAVLVANPAVGPELERRYDVRAVPIPNYPAEAEPPPPRDVRTLPGGAAIPPDAPIVLYVGGFSPERGIEQLIDAMVEVPGAHLVLLGGGGLEPELRRRVDERHLTDRTHFLGMVPSTEVVPYAASATVGVLSTLPTNLNNRLALPNKLFQYMAAGIPVVASDLAPLREVIEEADCGILVDPMRPAAIATALRTYIDDRQRAVRDGANGRRAVTDRYHWGLSAARLLDVYRQLEDSR